MKDTAARQEVLDSSAFFLPFNTLKAPSGYTVTSNPAGDITVSPAPVAARAPRGAFSFWLRLRDPGPAGDRLIVSDVDSMGAPCFQLLAAQSGLVFELFTAFTAEPLRMSAPLSATDTAVWHDVIGRYSGPHVEFFVDGVLVDEEWPLGAVGGVGGGRILLDGGPGRALSEAMDHFAVWHRALDNAEVEALSGRAGQDGPRGPVRSRGTLQYGRAPGGGNVGDCFPFFHDGVFHFFYLLDRRHHASKHGLGAHQWAHASSRDLVAWDLHPLAVAITEEREGSICTGSLFFHESTWYAYYATRLPDRSEHLSLAVSPDGITFTKTDPNPFASPLPPYRSGPFRDPHVFADPRTGLFHMLVTAELERPAVAGRGGCLAHLTSPDLRNWRQHEPFLITGYGDQPECSELFEWHGWYYLVFSHYGIAHYRMGRSPFGPWTRPRVDVLDGPLARVMKSAPFTGDRRIGAFFLAEGAYAGRVVFREIIQHADGTLGSSLPREMGPPSAAPVSLHAEALGEGVEQGDAGTGLRIRAPQGLSAAALHEVPRRFLFSARVKPSRPCGAFGIGVGGRGFQDALLLEFQPSRRRVGWRTPGRPSWQEEETAALYEVDGLDQAFSVELVILDDVLDLCVDRRRTLINRASPGNGDRLFLYCHEGEVEFSEIEVRPLIETVP